MQDRAVIVVSTPYRPPPPQPRPYQSNFRTASNVNFNRPLLPDPTGSAFKSSLPVNQGDRTLSVSEMTARKQKDLCMYCGDAYTPGHHLIHRKMEFKVMHNEEIIEE